MDQVKFAKERSNILEEKAKLKSLKAKFQRRFTLEGQPKYADQLSPEEEADRYMLAAIHQKLNLIDMMD